MGRRAGRTISLCVIIGAAVFAACTPPPGDASSGTTTTSSTTTTSTTTTTSSTTTTSTTLPPPSVCQSAAAPGAADRVAVVDPDGPAPPTVVEFEAADAAAVQREVAQLDRTATVLAVGKDRPVRALSVDPSDDDYYPPTGTNGEDGQWGFGSTKLAFETAWNTNGFDGSGVRVAVIDTGVQAQSGDHLDLFANVVAGKDFVTPDAASDFARRDGNGHGTHVAGIIAGVDNSEGVVGGAPLATIVPVRVLNCDGSGTYADVIAGILWASDSIATGGGGAQVINLSLGGSSGDATLQTAIQTAVGRGVVVVASAGNCGTGCGSPPNTPNYPAVYDEVIAVGAIQPDGAKAWYSNNNTYVDVAAPGSHVISTYSTDPNHKACSDEPAAGYCYLSGTSMAAPHVAALAALLVEACPASSHTSSTWSTWVHDRIASTAWATAIAGFAGPVHLANAAVATTAVPCP